MTYNVFSGTLNPTHSLTPKMHVNTNSAFDVNYEIAIKCIELH